MPSYDIELMRKHSPALIEGIHLRLSVSFLGLLRVQSHDFLFFHNKFAFGEYIHVHSVVLNVWFVKCSQITMFTVKISP